MTAATKVRRGHDFSETLCHWCLGDCPGSPYRTPVEGIPAARWTVCGPECSKRPDGVRVFYVEVSE